MFSTHDPIQPVVDSSTATKTPRTRWLSGRMVALILLLLNIAYFSSTLISRARADEHLQLGDELPALELTEVHGQRLELKGRWLMLLYFDHAAPEPLRRAKYAEILHRRYAQAGLTVLGFTNGSPSELKHVADKYHITYPLARADEAINSSLKLHTHDFYFVLSDPEGKVRFSTHLLEPKDIRLLVERYVAGKIDYRPANATGKLAVGDQFPSLAAGPIGPRSSDSRAGFALPNSQLVVFSARCSPCSLENGLFAIRAWQDQTRGTNLTLLFSPKFVPSEITNHLTKNGLRMPAYLASQAIAGIEDPYSLEGYFDDEILVISIAGDGSVERIESWDQFAAPQTAQKGKSE